MATVAHEQSLSTWKPRGTRIAEMVVGTLRYMRRNPELIGGLCLILALLLFVVIGLGTATITGLLAGLAPAASAARLAPVEALRHE